MTSEQLYRFVHESCDVLLFISAGGSKNQHIVLGEGEQA